MPQLSWTWTSWPEIRAGVASGLLFAAAVPPSPLGLLGWVALVPLLAVLFSPRRIRSGEPVRLKALILAFGLSQHLVKLHWMLLLGEASPLTFKWAMPLLWILLAFYVLVPDLLALWVLSRLRKRFGMQGIYWMPGVWVLAEWLRGFGEMGFPWLGLGSTQLEVLPVLQLAGLLGELGVTLFVAWVNVLITVTWFAWRGEFPGLGRAVIGRWWAPSALLLMVGLVVAYGFSVIGELEREREERDGLAVGVVQANVDLRDKWDRARRDSTFVPYTRGTIAVADSGARLVVWAETAITFDLTLGSPYGTRVRELARRKGVFVYAGFVERSVDEEGRLDSYNSSLLLGDEGENLSRYRKMHLLPFGERMPFQDLLPFLGDVDFGQAEWTPGPEQTIFEVDGHRFASMICFESIFSRIGRRAVIGGAGFLVNITNDGWFGRTVLPYQHAWMAVMRAAENRVPLVRVANNGISFSVRPTGRVDNETGLFTREHFVARVTPRPGGSFYTRMGDLTLFLLLAAGFVLLVAIGRTAARDGARVGG